MSALRVAPGAGRLARRAGALLYLPDVAPDAAAAAGRDELMAAFLGAADDAVLPAVVAVAAAHRFTVGPFAAVSWRGPLAVLVHGALTVHTDDPAVPELSGARTRTWVERVLESPGPRTIRAGAAAQADTSLEAGVVPAGGFALDVAPVGQTMRDGTAPGPAASGRVLATGADEATLPPSALAAASDPVAPAEGGPPMIEGRRCAAGHLNPLTAGRCHRCGALVQPGADAVVRVPRPPLGTLVGADGLRLPLDRAYLIGRNPGAGGEGGQPVRIADPKLSRRHLEVRLTDWTVHITDLHTRNGTIVVPRPGAPPLPLHAGVAFAVEAGATIHLGSRTLVFEAADT